MTTTPAAIRAAFPHMPTAVLDLIRDGDLQREVPNWLTLFMDAYEDNDGNIETAWAEVLAVYDRNYGFAPVKGE